MAMSDLIKQVGNTVDYMDGYERHFETYIGDYSDISAEAKLHPVGSSYTYASQLSGLVSVSKIERIEAEKAKWSFEYSTESGDDDTDEDGQKFLKRTWSMQMSQIEYPLYKYLSADEAGQVASWENSPNDQKKEFKYTSGYDTDGKATYTTLTGKAKQVAEKIFKGIESVSKSLPTATRTTTYRQYHSFSTRAGKLNKIDVTPDNQFSEFDVEWLKVGYDWNQDQTGTWTLTETWTGAPSWDKNLYGNNQWKFVD